MDTSDGAGGEPGAFTEEYLRSLTTFGRPGPAAAPEPLSHFTTPGETTPVVDPPPPLPADLVGLMAAHVEVDLAGAERFASDLQLAVDRAQALLTRAGDLEVTSAAAYDAVSISAAMAMSRWGNGDAGRMLPALQAYLQRLDESVGAYRQNLAATRQTEQGNTTAFGGTPGAGG